MLALNVLLELLPQEGLCAAADWALNALLRVGLPCLSRYIFNDYLLKKRARLYDKRTSPNAAKPSGCCIRGAAKIRRGICTSSFSPTSLSNLGRILR